MTNTKAQSVSNLTVRQVTKLLKRQPSTLTGLLKKLALPCKKGIGDKEGERGTVKG
jgi:hypothetical protein